VGRRIRAQEEAQDEERHQELVVNQNVRSIAKCRKFPSLAIEKLRGEPLGLIVVGKSTGPDLKAKGS